MKKEMKSNVFNLSKHPKYNYRFNFMESLIDDIFSVSINSNNIELHIEARIRTQEKNSIDKLKNDYEDFLNKKNT